MVKESADELCTCVQCNCVCVNMYLQLSVYGISCSCVAPIHTRLGHM